MMRSPRYRDRVPGDLTAAVDEIDRRHRRGLLAPTRVVPTGWAWVRATMLPWLAMVIRLYGLLIAAGSAFSVAGWMITRPLGLAVAGVGLLYLEHRSEGRRGR
jgi:hypothetical protein